MATPAGFENKVAFIWKIADKLRGRFEISASEVAFQDLHQRARLGVPFISHDHAGADAMLDRIHNFIESNTDAVLAGWTSEKLDFDEMATLT